MRRNCKSSQIIPLVRTFQGGHEISKEVGPGALQFKQLGTPALTTEMVLFSDIAIAEKC